MTTEMLSITTPTYSDPSKYELTNTPRPTIKEPTDVIIKVYAASINPIDLKKASGALKLALSEEFPYKIGYDCAGVVTEVGGAVTRLQVGDEVYVRLPEASRGSWSEYAKCAERFVALKPQSLSFGEAASLPLAAMTALQALRKYRGDLKGKTVFIPAGLSGTGAYACQLAKNVFNAGRVITTVSTAKIPLVPKLLGEGVVDQIIDYTKEDPLIVLPKASIDFVFDTMGQALSFLPLMVSSTSFIASVSTLPSGTTLQNSNFMQRPDNPRVPLLFRVFLDVMDAISRFRAWRWGVEYEYFFLSSNRDDLDDLRGWVESGKVKIVIGGRAGLRDLERVREICWGVYKGKGGVGKMIIDVIGS